MIERAKQLIAKAKIEMLSDNESFELAKIVTVLLIEDEQFAREVVINFLDCISHFPLTTKAIWGNICESIGYYPYLVKEETYLEATGIDVSIRTAFHKSSALTGFLHGEQKAVLRELSSGKNVILSAPTSFGKSVLIDELISEGSKKNIIIIQPTLALLDETRKRLQRYSGQYKIIVRTSQESSTEKGNIFLLTAERVVEYKSFPPIDLLVLDEFYKLSSKRDDERYEALNIAFNRILRDYGAQFYLLGPNIKSISEGFTQKYNAVFLKSDYKLVNCDVEDYYKLFEEEISNTESIGQKQIRERYLFELLDKLKEQTLVYCSSPDRARDLATKFYSFLNDIQVVDELKTLTEWLDENVNPEWDITKCIGAGIGVHDGALPRHLSNSIIRHFNLGHITTLFCTSTIIEGVNTTAKNIIYFDKEKGGRGKRIDYFDYSNIKGRAGRFMVHYVGKIFNFNPPPVNEEYTIDIPFFEQVSPVSKEILIHLPENDVKQKDSPEYATIVNLSEDERTLFRKNGVSIDGQRKIIEYLEENFDKNVLLKIQGSERSFPEYNLIFWDGYPSYEQLLFVVTLCWKYLKKPSESRSDYIVSPYQLAYLVNKYDSKKSVHQMINVFMEMAVQASENKSSPKHYKFKDMSRVEMVNESVKEAFQMHRHWLEYKLPKWISVMHNLQQYVCEKHNRKPGNYLFYSNGLENDFIPPKLSILIEYGIPSTAITKFASKIPEEVTEDSIVEYLGNNKETIYPLLADYEKGTLEELLKK